MKVGKKFPVVEVFGPTVQGEGVDQGAPCLFIRFGGCDYKCNWCDTPHAVLPEEVRGTERLTALEIIERLEALHLPPYEVILSGGNPVMHDISFLVKSLWEAGYRPSVETQGTLWKDWVSQCKNVCVSPKPPSSGMKTDWEKLDRFLSQCTTTQAFLKVVVFDERDLEYAARVHLRYPNYKFFLSAGNDAGRTVGNPGRDDTRTRGEVVEDLLVSSRNLVERALADDVFADARIQSQYHVLLWGNKQGV